MRNDEMAKAFMTWGYTRESAISKAEEIARLSENKFYAQVADSLRANGKNRKTRRLQKQRGHISVS